MEGIKELFGPTVGYSPLVAEITGSIGAAILLNQLLYWWERKKEGKETVYKTISEISSETFLSRHQQDNAIKILSGAGFVKTVLKGTPPKRHFTINIEKITKAIKSFQKKKEKGCIVMDGGVAGYGQSDLPENGMLICRKATKQFDGNRQIDLSENGKTICQKAANSFVGNRQILYTEITTKTTTKNTTENTTIPCGEKKSPGEGNLFSDVFLEEKKENNPPLLREPPLEKEKKEKTAVLGFSGTTKKMKDDFLCFYREKTGLPYYWQGRDSKNILWVEKKISFMLLQMQKIPDDETVSTNFRAMLDNITDKWILENLNVSVINMKFNEIVSKIKNRNDGNDKQTGCKGISPGYERELLRRLRGETVQ